MDNTLIKDKICNLLESVAEKTESINKTDKPESLMEIDLVLDELKQLYKEFYLLKKINERQLYSSEKNKEITTDIKDTSERTFPRKFVTPPPKDEIKEPQDIEKEEEPEKEIIDSKEDDIKKEKEERPIKDNLEKVEQERKEVSPQKQTEDTENETKQTSESTESESLKKGTPKKAKETSGKRKNKSVAEVAGKQQSKAIGDKYVANEDTSLNVRLSKMKEAVDIGTRMQHKPIKNLKESIGVNEKFLFINELFEGDIDAYNEAINKLNSFENIDEAFDYINTLNENYSWDIQDSPDTIDKFAYLVQRRYMT